MTPKGQHTEPLPSERTAPTPRRTLFGHDGTADAIPFRELKSALDGLRQTGYQIDRLAVDHWRLTLPGRVIQIHLHSPAQVCHFARFRARDYAGDPSLADLDRTATA